jgi:hypothetical protein
MPGRTTPAHDGTDKLMRHETTIEFPREGFDGFDGCIRGRDQTLRAFFRTRLAKLSIGTTILISSFLLFQVQPLIAKLILPWFGGSAAVWTSCMLFFQTALLAGYAYAHWLSKQRTGVVAAIHITLLGLSLASLPVIPAERWKYAGAGAPLTGILLLLTVTVGLPYLLLSATGPMLQSLSIRRGYGALPWRYFALSNAGAMAGLLTYPTLAEQYLTGRQQATVWSAGYTLFASLCGALLLRSALLGAPGIRKAGDAPPTGEPIGIRRFCLWAALAAGPSALLLAVTNHLSQNIAAVPFLWVLPLSAYLLSLILCFDSPRWYVRGLFPRLAAVAITGVSAALYAGDFTSVRLAITGYIAAAFVLFMVCHGELYRHRPAATGLTMFYLTVAFGGAAGGALVAVVAPSAFNALYDLPVVIVFITCGLAYLLWMEPAGSGPGEDGRQRIFPGRWERPVLWGLLMVAVGFLTFRMSAAAWLDGAAFLSSPADKAIIAGIAIVIGLVAITRFRPGADHRGLASAVALLPALTIAGLLGNGIYHSSGGSRLMERNFYGALMVDDIVPQGRIADSVRYLMHGTVNHGVQFLAPDRKREPTTYYGRNSGIGRAMAVLGRQGPLSAGFIGLGTGTLAAYGRPGDSYRFYEINPLVARIAAERFSFLKDCQAPHVVITGDGRLSLEAEPPGDLDLLVLDAFSGDAVPVHLLTREAFRLYWQHLKPGGVIAVHASNRYVNLGPVVLLAGFESAKDVRLVQTDGDEAALTWASEWYLITSQVSIFDAPELAPVAKIVKPKEGFSAWTDDNSNLYSILR